MTASRFTIKTFHPVWYFIINRQRKERERERWQFTVIVLKSASIILRVIRHARSISISRGRIRRKKRVSDTDCEKKKKKSLAIRLRDYRLFRYIHQRSFNANAQWSRSVFCIPCIMPVIDGRPNKRTFLRMYGRGSFTSTMSEYN